MTTPVSPGWAIELQGEKIDLDDFEIELTSAHTPWLERDGETLLLRSSAWEGLPNSRAVMRDGYRLIELLNGAARLVHDDAREVRLGALRRFDDRGRPLPVTIEANVNVRLSGDRMRGYAVTSDLVTVQGPSLMQRAIAAADKDTSDYLAELLLHIARVNNWFDLYKVMELAQGIKGGDRKLAAALQSNNLAGDARVWEDVRRSANHYRHARSSSHPLPPNPPATPDEALIRILPTLRRIVRREL